MIKYANEMTDDVIHSTKYYIKYYPRQFEAETIETRQANSSKCNTPTALTISVTMATYSFPVPPA